jgi:CelD/BcsL family acetyltransferase involved in cellulose biosynthesis
MTALAPAPTLGLRARCAPDAAAFTIAACDFWAAEALWRELETSATASPYQRFDWQRAYVAAMAPDSGFDPQLLVVRDGGGRPALLMPLAITCWMGLRVAAPAGGKHANYHLPLVARNVPIPAPPALRALLRQAGRMLGIDAYLLANQPKSWDGLENPLAEGGRASPSNGYRLMLSADAEETLARALSKDARKKLRQKSKKLNELGPVTHRVAKSAQEVDLILAAFYEQKRVRFQEMGVANPFEAASTQAFLRAASLAGLDAGRPAIELHALTLGERPIAVFGGAVSAHRCSGMFISFEQSPEIARSSPGDLLLAEVIRFRCRRGRRAFDLGVGEARYKNSFCNEVEELVDVTIAVTLRGHAYAAAVSSLLRAKAFVKQTPWLWAMTTRLRASRPSAV